jgi:iron complex outermembrane recepter protein
LIVTLLYCPRYRQWLSFLLLACLGESAGAQIVDKPNSSESKHSPRLEFPRLETIVVSARRIEQPSLHVPAAITAYSGATLETLSLDNLSELSVFLPNLRIQEQSVNSTNFVLRGISSNSNRATLPPRVSVFQDGIDISSPIIANVALFDMQQIEAVNGPQATRFSRAAQIGAINLVQNKAGPDNKGKISASIGSDNLTWINGYHNAALSDDLIFGRVAYYFKKADGYIDNQAGGSLQGTDTRGLRTSLHWGGERTELDIIVNYQKDQPPGT